jgi:hypothetical protein
MFDELAKNPLTVIPAKAGVQNYLNFLDSRFHGNDVNGLSATFYESIIFETIFYFLTSTPILSGAPCQKIPF